MRYMGNLGCFPWGKQAPIARRYPAFVFLSCMQCFRVSIPLTVRPTLLRQMDMGSLTWAQIWVLAAHTKGGSSTNKSAQELTRRDRKTAHHLAPPGDRTQGLRIDFWRTNRSAMSPINRPTLIKAGQSRWGESRDNWRKHHQRGILSIYCFWFINIAGRLSYLLLFFTAHIPIWLKQRKSFQLHFSQNGCSSTTCTTLL